MINTEQNKGETKMTELKLRRCSKMDYYFKWRVMNIIGVEKYPSKKEALKAGWLFKKRNLWKGSKKIVQTLKYVEELK